MLIRRIQMRNFRKIVEPLEISGVGPGLTVIAGDNEAGKSTMLDAVRTALFERHNVGGRVLEDMMPYGSTVQPEIALDFEIDGASYALRKAFGRAARAELETPSGRFEGPAADEGLARLMQFDLVDGRANDERRREARGIIGLLWLEQGHVHQGLRLGGRGQQTVRGALEDEVGDVLGGTRGRRLREAANKERALYLTPTGRPTGRLADAHRAATEAKEELEDIERRLREYEGQIDILGRKEAQLSELEANRTIEILNDRQIEANAKARELDVIEEDIRKAATARELAEARASTAADRLERRKTLVADAENAATKLREFAQEIEAAKHADVDWRGREEAARAEASKLQDRLQRAKADRRALEAGRRASELNNRDSELSKLLDQLAQVQASRARVEVEWSEIKVDADQLKRIRELDSDLRDMRTRRDAAATRVTPRPIPGQFARLDGKDLPPDEPVELCGSSEFELTGWGRILVAPSVVDLGRLVDEVERLEVTFTEALEGIGCDLSDAEARSARGAELDT